MTSELREGLLGSAAAREPGQGDKGPEDDDNDARLASRGFGGFMRETGRIALDALPVYAFNVSQFANNILSQAFIGHLGSKELAASALAISYMNVMCQTVNYGLATGQETVVSQANGARRYREVGACLQRGLIVLVVTQLIMSCVSFFGARILIGLGQDETLAKMAGQYIRLSIPTMWGSGYSTVMCTWLQAQGIFRPVVALGLPGLGVQVAGLYYFLPRFGYLGAAAATAASAWTSALLFTGYAVWLERVHRDPERRALPDGACGALRDAWNGVGTYLKIALPSFSMILFEWSALEVAVLYSGVLKDSASGVPTAVSAMIMGAITCAYAWSLALSQVASSRVGNALGEGHGAVAKFRARCAWFLQLCFALSCQLALYAHRADWAAVFASKKEHDAFRAARNVYPVLAGILFCDANAALHSGFVRGLGLQHVGGPLNLSAFYVVGIPLSTLFTFKLRWGLRGIWGGIAGAFAAQAVSLGALVWGFADFEGIAARVSTEAAYAQLSEGESDSDYDTDDAGSIPGLFDSDAEHERFQVSDVEAGSPMTKPQFMRRVSSRTRLGGQYARHGSARSLGGMVSHPSSDSLASSFSRSLTNAAVVGGGFQRRTSGTYGSRVPMAPLSASFGSPPGEGGSGGRMGGAAAHHRRARRRRSNASSQASDATSNGN